MPACAQAPLYRQREFHQSPLLELLVDHGEDFLQVNDSRYRESHGPLPLSRPRSRKTRVYPRCINRRAEVLSHSLAEKQPGGDYRHLVVTPPKKMGLRKRFQLGTRLHRQIGRPVHRVITRYAGHFANSLGNLNPKPESQAEKSAEKPKPGQIGQVAHSDRANLGGRARTLSPL